MRPFYFLCICLFLCFPLVIWGDQLIVEPDMGRQPILDAIHNTKQTLKVIMYEFTDQSLLQAIMQQKKLGRSIKIMLEQTPYHAEKENLRTISLLQKHQIDWQGSIPNIRLIHQKTLLIDGKRAMVMTFNFTHATFKNDRNFALIVDDPIRVREIEAMFDADWHQTMNSAAFSTLIWSPDNSRKQLLGFIKQAKQSIDIYAQNLNDYQIIGALAKAAKRSVMVKILTSSHLRKGQIMYLTRAGVKVKRSQTYYIHAKSVLIDAKTAIIGSINFTSASLDHNRELAVATQDTNVVKTLQKTFANDWRIA